MELNQIEDTNNFEKVNNNTSNNKIKVAVMKDAVGFAVCEPKFSGFIIEIWETAAKKYNWDYEYYCYDGEYNDVFLDISKGKYDVALGDFGIVKRRTLYANYTRPYYLSKMIVFKENKLSSFLKILLNFVIRGFLIFLFFLLISYTFLYKYYTKKTLFDSFYFVLLHIFSDDSELIPLKIRGINQNFIISLNTLWIFLRYTFFAIIITQLIDIIIRLQKSYISDDELSKINRIYGEKGTLHISDIETLGKIPIPADTLDNIMDKLVNSPEDNIYVYQDYLVAKDEAKKRGIELIFTENPIFVAENALVVSKNRNDILEKLNNVIIDLRLNGKMKELCLKAFDNDYENCVL